MLTAGAAGAAGRQEPCPRQDLAVVALEAVVEAVVVEVEVALALSRGHFAPPQMLLLRLVMVVEVVAVVQKMQLQQPV